MRGALIAAAALAAVAAVLFRWLAPSEPARTEPPQSPAVAAKPEPAPTPAAAPVPAAPAPEKTPAPAKEPGTMVFPDGSKLPALNGVTGEVKVDWGVRPFTKVVGIEDGPGGWKWYVHENGTRSTTAMNTMHGVTAPMSIVAEPERAAPLAPGSEPQAGTGTGPK